MNTHFLLNFFVFIILSVGMSFADAPPTKHVDAADMGTDFEDNPPQCYPQSSKNWEDQYSKDALNKGRFFGAVADCKAISKKLQRDYYVTGGGIVHAPDAKKLIIPPNWHPMQSQPTVSEPGVHTTDGWKCTLSKPDKNLPISQFTCLINCCQLGVEQSTLNSEKSNYIDTGLPALMGNGTTAARIEILLTSSGISAKKVVFLNYTAREICKVASMGRIKEYDVAAFFSEYTGYFTVNNTKLFEYPSGTPLSGISNDNASKRIVSKVLCKKPKI